jgi:hypothetical protein
VLGETDGGPCRILAVLQAHITFAFFRRKNAAFVAFVRDPILRIHDRILSSTYAFCTGFDSGARTFDFLLTHGRSLAVRYLEESGYCVSARAVLSIVINFIFASIRFTELNAPAEPFTEGCRITTVALAFLIPNGEMNSMTLQRVASQEFLGLEEKKIGFRVLSIERPDLIGKWLGPKAEILAVLLGHSLPRCEDDTRKKAAFEVGLLGGRRALLLPTDGAQLGR